MRHGNLRTLAAIVGIALLAGCGDARLGHLRLGMSSDSISTVIGQPPHRTMTYLTAGKHWGVELYSRSSADPKDSIAWRKMSPVVTIDGKVVGWGWKWWGHEAATQHFNMPAE